MDSVLWNKVLENNSKKINGKKFSCRPWRFVSSISTMGSNCTYSSNNSVPYSKFLDEYTLGTKLGKGSYSTVRVGTHKGINKNFAIKIVYKDMLSQNEKNMIKDEVSILKSLDHENIIKLHSIYNEEKFYFLVTEYCKGGNLYNRILKKTKYSEKESQQVSITLLNAIGYCHLRNIAHRDLKPENLLLTSNDNNVQIKIADFGFAKLVPESGFLTTRCGSPNYIAPEVLFKKPYGVQVDMWSIGVILYILLSGHFPFNDSSAVMLYRKIRAGAYDFNNHSLWGGISAEAKDLISKLLVTQPLERYTFEEALDHEWFHKEEQEDGLKFTTRSDSFIFGSSSSSSFTSLSTDCSESSFEDFDYEGDLSILDDDLSVRSEGNRLSQKENQLNQGSSTDFSMSSSASCERDERSIHNIRRLRAITHAVIFTHALSRKHTLRQ